MAAVVVALALAWPSDQEDVADAARFALAPSAQPAPAERGAFVDASVGDLRFPSYGYALGYQATGVREDRLDGHRTVTVAYRAGADRVGYTIVDGPVGVPDGAERVRYRGVDYAVLRADGAVVVSWRRGDKTCVLASKSADQQALLQLAGWRAPT